MSRRTAPPSTDLRDLQQSVGTLLAEIEQTSEHIVEEFEAEMNPDSSGEKPTAPAPAAEPKPVPKPEATPPPPADEDLTEQVDELIADAVEAVDALEETIESVAEADEASESAVAQVADEVDELLSDVENAIPEATEPAAEVAEASPDEPISAAVEIDTAAVNETKVEPEQPSVSGGAINALDAQLESEADDLDLDLDDFEGDFETADEVESATTEENNEIGAIDEAADAPAPAPAAVGAAMIEIDSPFADEDPAPAPGIIPTPEPEPTSAPTAEAPATDDQIAPQAATKGLKSKVLAFVPVVQGVVLNPTLRSHLTRFVLTPLAKPLAKLDPKIRDTVGWVGVNTVFIAVCLWLFLILR